MLTLFGKLRNRLRVVQVTWEFPFPNGLRLPVAPRRECVNECRRILGDGFALEIKCREMQLGRFGKLLPQCRVPRRQSALIASGDQNRLSNQFPAQERGRLHSLFHPIRLTSSEIHGFDLRAGGRLGQRD